MKTKLLVVVLLVGAFFLCTVAPTQALQLTSFIYDDIDYGVMDISIVEDDPYSLLIGFTLNPGVPTGTSIAGFAFDFDSTDPITVSDPDPGDYADDNDNLDWYFLKPNPHGDLTQLPNPTNSNTITKGDFSFGVTTDDKGKNINQANGGITAVNPKDYFILTFTTAIPPGDLEVYEIDGEDGFVNLAGIRIQSLPDDINGGSLFLVPVPEPATMLLLGSGLIGLAAVGRKKFFKKR